MAEARCLLLALHAVDERPEELGKAVSDRVMPERAGTRREEAVRNGRIPAQPYEPRG